MEKTDLKKILSVSGEHGLFAYVAQGRGGIIAESLETHQRQMLGASASHNHFLQRVLAQWGLCICHCGKA